MKYEYRDANLDPEDESKRVIRWFINGTRIPYLDNVLKWNDLANGNDPFYKNVASFSLAELKDGDSPVKAARERSETIVKAGDLVSATIEVSDGTLLSDPVATNVVSVGEGSPELSGTKIVAQRPDGAISDSLTTNDTAILKFDLLADTKSNRSELVWYVNDEEFKRGVIGEAVNIDRISPGEVSEESGQSAMVIGNEIYVEIIPQTDGATGTTVTTDAVVIGNGVPIARNVLTDLPSHRPRII